MKTKSIVLLVLFALAAAPKVLANGKPHLRGESAYAVFHLNHPNGCTETDAIIYVLNNAAYEPGDPAEFEPRVEFAYGVFGQPTAEPSDGPKSEWCDGLFYYELHGSAPLADGDFTVAGNLGEAELHKTFTVFDEEGFVFMEVTVDVVWTATGHPEDQARSAVASLSVTSPSLSPLYIINPLSPSIDGQIRRVRPGGD